MGFRYTVVYVNLFLSPFLLATEKPLDLDEILALAQSQTPDQQIIAEEKRALEAEVAVYQSEVLPKMTFNTTAQRKSESGYQMPDQQPKGRSTFNQHLWELRVAGPLIAFGRLGAIYRIAKQQSQLAHWQAIAKQQEYLLMVVESYSAALLAANYQEVAKRAAIAAKETMQFSDTELRGGSATQIDNLRSKAEYQRAIAEFKRREMAAAASLSRLKNLLGLKHNDPLRLRGGMPEPKTFLMIKGTASDIITPQQQVAKTLSHIGEMNLRYQRAQHYPTISWFASVGTRVTDPQDEFGDLSEEKRWDYAVGLSFDWTLFSGFATSATVRKTAAEATIARLEWEQLQRSTQVNRREAEQQMVVAREFLGVAKESRKVAQMLYDQARLDFREGSLPFTSYQEVEDRLRDAERSVYDAFANIISATATLKVMTGQNLGGG